MPLQFAIEAAPLQTRTVYVLSCDTCQQRTQAFCDLKTAL
jgi:hypothetical protein